MLYLEKIEVRFRCRLYSKKLDKKSPSLRISQKFNLENFAPTD